VIALRAPPVPQPPAEREAAADTLADGHDVGSDAELFIGKEPAHPRHAGLDFVQHEKESARVAEFAQALQKTGGSNVDADFTLDRFDKNPCGLRPGRAHDRVEIAIRHLIEAIERRAESL